MTSQSLNSATHHLLQFSWKFTAVILATMLGVCAHANAADPGTEPPSRSQGQGGASNEQIKVYSTVLNPKDVADIFGKRIGQRFIAIQVTVANRNSDLQFLIHDITIDLSRAVDPASGQPALDLSETSRNLQRLIQREESEQRKTGKPEDTILRNLELMRTMLASISVTGGGNRYRMSSIDLQLLRGVAEKGYVMDPRNLTIRLLRGAGTIAGGIIGVASFGPSFAPSVAAFNGPLISAAERAFPDFTINQLNRLNDTAYEVNSLVPRQQGKVMVVFIPQSFFMTDIQRKQFWDDPGSLSIALNIFAATITVEGTFVEELEGQPPSINGVIIDGSESKKFQTDKPQVRGTITGKFLSGAGIGFAGQTPEGMTVELQGKPTFNYLEFLLKSDHPLKPGTAIELLAVNKEGSQKYSYIVNYDPDKPTVTEVVPGSGKQGAAGLQVTLKGTGFIPGLTTVAFGDGISVVKTEVKSGTQIVGTIHIDQNATLGKRKVLVLNGGAFSDDKSFEVTKP